MWGGYLRVQGASSGLSEAAKLLDRTAAAAAGPGMHTAGKRALPAASLALLPAGCAAKTTPCFLPP